MAARSDADDDDEDEAEDVALGLGVSFWSGLVASRRCGSGVPDGRTAVWFIGVTDAAESGSDVVFIGDMPPSARGGEAVGQLRGLASGLS